VRTFAPRGVILSGGPESVTDVEPPRAPDASYTLGVPVLGICYGMQTMAQQLVAASRRLPSVSLATPKSRCRARAGFSIVCRIEPNPDGAPVLDVWMSHGDHVDVLPEGFSVTASTDAIAFAAMTDERRRFYGVQFHPEVTHTRQGAKLLERFVREICGCARCGASATSSTTLSRGCARKWGRAGYCWASPAASTPPSSQRSCIAPSAISWCASLSITACCARAKVMQ
jgi:GMP synthase (glutamine-hydrolysing)